MVIKNINFNPSKEILQDFLYMPKNITAPNLCCAFCSPILTQNQKLT